VSSDAPAVPRRNRFVAVLLLLLTFTAGLVAGFAIDRVSLVRQRRIIPARGMAFISERLVRRLDRQVDLDPAQEQQVSAVLHRRLGNIEGLWSGVRPRVDEEVDAAYDEVEKILTEEQRVKFRKIRERWQARSRGL
jgi:hypothetical protein